jgi:hypothetical protein
MTDLWEVHAPGTGTGTGAWCTLDQARLAPWYAPQRLLCWRADVHVLPCVVVACVQLPVSGDEEELPDPGARVWLLFAAAGAWELLAACMSPHQHTYFSDSWTAMTLVTIVHFVGAYGVRRKRDIAIGVYAGVVVWLLSTALLEWWFPYLFNMAPPDRVVHVVESLKKSEALVVSVRQRRAAPAYVLHQPRRSASRLPWRLLPTIVFASRFCRVCARQWASFRRCATPSDCWCTCRASSVSSSSRCGSRSSRAVVALCVCVSPPSCCQSLLGKVRSFCWGFFCCGEDGASSLLLRGDSPVSLIVLSCCCSLPAPRAVHLLRVQVPLRRDRLARAVVPRRHVLRVHRAVSHRHRCCHGAQRAGS